MVYIPREFEHEFPSEMDPHRQSDMILRRTHGFHPACYQGEGQGVARLIMVVGLVLIASAAGVAIGGLL